MLNTYKFPMVTALRLLLMLALVAMSFSALAAKPVNTLKNSFFASQTDTAINGYDTHEGKLYLNYDASVQKDWLKDIPGYIKKADAKFQSLLTK